jgi:hypothetical protein
VPLEHLVDHDHQRHQQSAETERMFGRALWLKENLPITPDEWGLLCVLIFGEVPEKRPTPEEFADARARHTSLRELTPIAVDDESRGKRAHPESRPRGERGSP